MAWTAPRTWVTNEVVTAAIMNTHVRGNLTVLSTHAHSGAAGQGSAALGNLTHITFTDAAPPAAPGSGVTRLYTSGGEVHFRAGTAGADGTLANTAHASSHEPGGSDPMTVDAVAATGSLRTLGTGAQQAAAGDHTHTLSVQQTGSKLFGTAADVPEGTLSTSYGFQKRVTLTPVSTHSAITMVGQLAARNTNDVVTRNIFGRLLIDSVQKKETSQAIAANGNQTWLVVHTEVGMTVASHNFDAEFKTSGGSTVTIQGSGLNVREVDF